MVHSFLRKCVLLVLLPLSVFALARGERSSFRSILPRNVQRVWIGPEYWANPLQDWRLDRGRIECVVSGGERNLFLLTHELNEKRASFRMSVRLGRMESESAPLDTGWVGFSVGIRGEFNDYRDNAIRGSGLAVGITTGGELFIGSLRPTAPKVIPPFQNIILLLEAQPLAAGYLFSLSATGPDGKLLASMRDTVDGEWLSGGLALMCHRGPVPMFIPSRKPAEYPVWGTKPGTQRGGNVVFWFSDWELSGGKLSAYPDRSFGSILFAQYTLSKGILKVTAQMAPVGESDGKTVQFFIRRSDGAWKEISQATIDRDARTAAFRIEGWETARDIPYRLVHHFAAGENAPRECTFEGMIRREPWHKNELVVAAFTGNNDLGFPNSDLAANVRAHDPDLLFFSGDQIYEGVGGYGIQTEPMEQSILDYLRKWYLYGWAYRELLRDRPAISIPDDHDVYHGNLWGAGGRATPEGLRGMEAQDAGGYKMPARWVNMVQRTQTSHLPDPVDPVSAQQGIGVYFCEVNYAGISFAVVEDRKFKSAPKPLLPKAQVRNGWAQNKEFDPEKEADAPGADLLGERQLRFLREWAADWSKRTWMKVVLSQTLFSTVATLPAGAMSDDVVPGLQVLAPGDYPPDDKPVADMDSDGWPQSGRNKALREMRRGFALHIAGDQHLGSTIQYGIDDWRDAGFAICVPSISNVWPRRWFPTEEGRNRQPGAPRYTGDFKDGFGNKMTVHAVSNPFVTGLRPARLYDRATGYGIVRFHRDTRAISLECWPRWISPADPNAKPYPGWPVTFYQTDNYGRKAVAYLPTLNVVGMQDPVVQLVEESTKEIVYTLRIRGSSFRPKVFSVGTFTLFVGEPGTEQWKRLTGVKAVPVTSRQELTVKF